jgi:hypothetical protein
MLQKYGVSTRECLVEFDFDISDSNSNTLSNVIKAVSDAKNSPADADKIGSLIERKMKIEFETELVKRIEALEEKSNG